MMNRMEPFSFRRSITRGVMTLLVSMISISSLAIEPAANKNYMGINVWFLSDADKASPFVDVVKSSRAWGSVAAAWTPISNVDSLGWPLQDAGLVISSRNTLKQGVYKVSFTGSAVVIVRGVGTLSHSSYNSGSNTTTLDWTLPQTVQNMNVWFTFENTKRTAGSAMNTGITNLKIIRPEYTQTFPAPTFTTEFLAAINKFECVRFMDWVDTNRNPTENWADRTLPSHSTQSRFNAAGEPLGVAVEYMIELCNETDSDLWINIPCRATDDYTTKLAKHIRYGSGGYPALESNLKVYIEYGNETWNTAPGFMCYRWIHDEFVASIRANEPGHPILSNGDTGEYAEMTDYTVWRGAEASQIFRSVFGDSAMMTRIRPLYSSQIGNARGTLSDGLGFIESYYPNPPKYYFYGAGGSSYFDPKVYAPKEACFSSIPDDNFKPRMTIDSVWCHAFGLKHISYEGGIGFANPDNQTSTLTDEEIADYNADYRMKDVVIDNYNRWSNYGGDLNMFYVLAGAGPWAYTHDILDSVDTPKMQGIDALRWSTRAAVTVGTAIPGTIQAATALDEAGWVTFGGNHWVNNGILNVRGSILIPLRTTSTSSVTVQFNHQRLSAPLDVEVWVNGESYGIKTLPVTGSTFATSDLFSFTPASGLNVLRVSTVNSSDALTLDYVTVSSGGTVTPPQDQSITITSPANYSTVTTPFTVNVTAGDASNVTQVDFWHDNWRYFASDTTGPTFSAVMTGEFEGENPHKITARVWYNDGSRIDTEIYVNVGDASTPPPSSDVLIDFEAAPTGLIASGVYSDPSGFIFEEDGYGKSMELRIIGVGEYPNYSSSIIQNERWNRTLSIRKADGSEFNLTSFDYAIGQWADTATATVIATFTDGTTKNVTISTRTKVLATQTFSNWQHLDRIEIFCTVKNMAFDNFGLTASGGDAPPPSSNILTDFETATPGLIGSGTYSDSSGLTFEEDGYGASMELRIIGTGEYPNYSSVIIQNERWSRTLRVRKTNGSQFSLVSFDYAVGQWADSASSVVTAIFADGTTDSLSISTRTKELTTQTLSNWENLTYVEIRSTSKNMAFDNFVTTE